MNWLDGVAESAESYAAIAVRIASEDTCRAEQRETILSHAERLFADPEEIEDLAQALRDGASAAHSASGFQT
jgi:hypothetical protein